MEGLCELSQGLPPRSRIGFSSQIGAPKSPSAVRPASVTHPTGCHTSRCSPRASDKGMGPPSDLAMTSLCEGKIVPVGRQSKDGIVACLVALEQP